MNADVGWAVGENGLCLATKDSGQTWTKVAVSSAATLRSVRFLDTSNGFACGDGDPAAPAPKERIATDRPLLAGTLLSTADGGKTWKAAWIETNRSACCVEALDAANAFVATSWREGEVMRRDGNRWQSSRCYREIFDMRAVDAKRWIAVGAGVSISYYPSPPDTTYANRSCRALFSSDGGRTWNASKGADGRPLLRALAVRKDAPTVAVGDQGTILVSADLGETWKAAEAAGVKSDLRSVVWCAEAQLIIAVGKAGAVAFSADNAKTWKVASAGAATLNSVAAAGGFLVAVGEKGTILRAPAKELK